MPQSREQVDGVGQHAMRLAEALEAGGDDTRLTTPEDLPGTGTWDIAHLHYVPFSFPAYGLGAARVALRLRRLAPLVITIHEPRIGYELSPRGTLLAAAQDGVLQLLARLAAGVIVTTGRWKRFLRGVPAQVVPSGSVLEMHEQPRPRGPEPQPTIGIITSSHPGRMQHLSEDVARRMTASGSARAIAIGAGEVSGVATTGYLEPAALAAAMAACDLLLLPYLDGVTGRRTSFISALQLGVPTLTTLAAPMDDFPVQGGFEYTSPLDEGAFARRAEALAGDADRRAEVGRQARMLFQNELAWPLLAARVRAVYARAVA